MRNLENELKNKTINFNQLLEYGFIMDENKYILKTKIFNNQFEMIVKLSDAENTSKLIDLANGEEYILVDLQDSTGEYVGKVRKEYEEKIQDIFNKCTSLNIFKSEQSKEVIKYIKNKYNDELEFLWGNLEETAIWRNKNNNKWYGIIMTLQESKLGINSEKIVEIIDLRYQKERTNEVIDNKKIFAGYHMNQKSWITIKLDDTVDLGEIVELINNSYNLSFGSKCGLTGNELSKRVYDYLTKIPKGKVVTYGQIASYLGNRGLSRVVGTILHKNPDGDKYPCYKVLNSRGELAEEFVFGGKNFQKKRLEKDGIKVVNNKVDLSTYQWKN